MTPTVPFRPVAGDVRSRLEALGVATIPDLYRLLANNPDLLEAWIDLAWSLRQRATTPRPLRELMILRSAQLHGASYQWNDHARMAAEAGVSPEQIAALEDWRSSSLFDEPVRSALAFTEEMVSGRVEDRTLAELARHFEPGERIELMMTAGFYCMVPRVLDALRLTAAEEG